MRDSEGCTLNSSGRRLRGVFGPAIGIQGGTYEASGATKYVERDLLKFL